MKNKHSIVRQTRVGQTSRLGWSVAMALFVGLLAVLYSIKARTLTAKTQVQALEQTLLQEKQALQMLAAEIAHLESPERLRILSEEQLGLQPTPVSRTLTLAEASDKMARREMKSPVVKAGGAQ